MSQPPLLIALVSRLTTRELLPQRRSIDLTTLGAVGASCVGPQRVASIYPGQVDSIRAQVAVVDLAVVANGLKYVLRGSLADAQALLAIGTLKTPAGGQPWGRPWRRQARCGR